MSGTETVWAFGGYQTPREEASAVLIPVAYDLTTTYGTGSRHGPRALLDASTHMELFDEELGFSPTAIGLHTLEIVEQIAAGPGSMVRHVSDLVREVLEEGKLSVLVGGEHSVTIGALLALEELRLPVTVLQFDAHADLREEFQGTPYSHACVMARARERFPAVQVGIRSISELEYERVQKDRLALFPARRLRENRADALRDILALLGPKLYLTIDLDVLDPSILPSTGTPEPGGLLWEDILFFVRECVKDRHVVGFDLMELAPIPGIHAPDFMAAKLLNKVLGYVRPGGVTP